MTDTKRQFLADCFGLAFNSPRMDQIMGILELEERDQKIDKLRGDGLSAVDIAARMGMDRSTVTRIIKVQFEVRKAG